MTPGGSLVPAKGNRGPPVPPVRRNFLRLSCCFCSLGTRAGESSGPWEDTPPEPQLLGEPEGVAGRKACSKRARPLPASTTLRPQRRRGLFPARWAWAFTLATGHRDSAQGSGRFVNAGGGAVFERPLPYPGSGGRVGDALVIADDTAPPPRGAEAFRRPACVRGACVVRGARVVRAWCVVRACVACGRAWCACMRHSEGAHAAACSSPGGGRLPVWPQVSALGYQPLANVLKKHTDGTCSLSASPSKVPSGAGEPRQAGAPGQEDGAEPDGWSQCCRQGDLAAEVRCLSGPPGVVEGPGAGGWIWGPAGSVPASPRPQLQRSLRGGGGGTSRSRQGPSGATPPLAGRYTWGCVSVTRAPPCALPRRQRLRVSPVPQDGSSRRSLKDGSPFSMPACN